MLRLLQHYGWVLRRHRGLLGGLPGDLAAGGMPGWPASSVGQRVLVERRGWFDDQRVAALRSAGTDVRQCPGPLPKLAGPARWSQTGGVGLPKRQT